MDSIASNVSTCRTSRLTKVMYDLQIEEEMELLLEVRSDFIVEREELELSMRKAKEGEDVQFVHLNGGMYRPPKIHC